MKSEINRNSEERITKATELLQKLWWFSFYLVISPLAIGFVSFWIFRVFLLGTYAALSLSVIVFMFAFLFFLKAYDKYRDNSFFLNKENNLMARIHIIFLISLLSFIVTPIFILISPADSFELLPLISFALLYNIVYYYFRYKPIAFYNVTEKEFQHGIDFKLTIRQPYNFIILINYIVQIIFLAITAHTNLSWVFGLLTNMLLYIITLATTNKTCSTIKETIKLNQTILIDLTRFKQKFLTLVTSLVFILLIQLPLINISILGVQYTSLELLNNSFLSLIFLLLYLKSIFYINIYYRNRIKVYTDSIKDTTADEKPYVGSIKYQRYNSFLSGFLIVFITTFAFLVEIPLIIIIVVPFLFIFSYSEQKAGICPKSQNRFIYLLNSLVFLISISFGLLSDVPLNFQFLIILLSLYFVFEIFVRNEYFSRENVIVIQNILAISSFTIIMYSFFEYTTFEDVAIFELALFNADPIIIFISNLLIHGLLISIVSIITFYVLFFRYFSHKPSTLFRSCLLINIFLIELFIFLLINFRTFFSIEILMFSSLLFPSILLCFVFINFLIGVFSKAYFSKLSYYLFWALIGNIFLSLLLVYLNNYVIVTLDFLILSFLSHLNLKYGLKIERVPESTVKPFVKANSYFMTIELISLFFFFFFSIALAEFALIDKIILSTYFSFLIMTVLANILSKNDVVFSSSMTNKINIASLFLSSGLAFYYPFILSIGTFYIFLLPFIGLFITLYLPFMYLIKKRIYGSSVKKALLINSALLAGFISLIPAIIGLEFSQMGQYVNVLIIANYTLLLFPFTFLFFGFTDYLLSLLSRKHFFAYSYYLLWILTIDIFIVLFIISIPNFVYLTLSFLFLSVFSPLNLKFGVNLDKVKDSTVKKYVGINSYVMTGELFALSFFFFFTIVLIDILLSLYVSLLVITILVNLLSRNEIVFSKSLKIRMNILTLTFSAGLAYYYSFLLTLNTYYVLLIPSLCLFSILFFPIYYMLKMNIFERFIHRILLIDCIFLAICVTLIPTIVNLEFVHRGIPIDIMTTLNFTLYIAFAILAFTYYLIKQYNLKEIYSTRILKSQIFIELIIAGTTVYYYTFIMLYGTFFSFLFPLIAASIFFYLPSIFSYRKRYFKESIVKKSLMANSIFLSGLVTLIPSIVGLELAQLGFGTNIYIIVAASLLLLFLGLTFLNLIGKWYHIKEKWVNSIRLLQVFAWFSISLFMAFVIYSYDIYSISLSISIFVFFILNIFTLKLLIYYSKQLKIINILKEFLLYGLIISFSFLTTSIIQFSDVFNFIPSALNSYNALWYLGLFFLTFLPLIRHFSSLVKIHYTKVNNGIGFGSWLILKIIICIFISIIFSYTILGQRISFLLTFSFFTPITLSYLHKLKIFSEKTQHRIKIFMLGLFIISILVLYIDLFNQLIANVVFFNSNLSLKISFIFVNLLLYSYFFLLRFNSVLEEDSTLQIFGFYLTSIILFLSLLYVYMILLIVPIFFTLILLLYRRSLNSIFRFVSYFLLSYVIFIDLLSIFSDVGLLGGLNLTLFGLLVGTYLLTLITVLLFSIWLNYKRNNNLEKVVVYSLFSLLSFVLLNAFTNILLLYNITISLFIFLLFIGIYFYRQNNEFYKWFIRPCVLLLVFDFVSFISYAILFNNPTYINFNPILTFSLTMSLTGFTFILLYNKAPTRFRKMSFYFILFAIIISFPMFLYFLIIASLPALIGDPVPIIIVINVGVFLYYLSVGIYHWRFSWAIWKSGWYVWNILPFVNFWIIYRSLGGVDILTESVELFGIYELKGSSILAIIICSLFFIPVLYTKIKKHFSKIILVVWAESLFLLYWISQNLFSGDSGLRNLSFILFSVVLLMPFLTGLKYWKLASLFWLGLMLINAFFLYFYLNSIGLVFEITVALDILIIGLFLMVYSFFPNIRSIGVVLLISYFIVLSGIFLVIYFVIYSIVLNFAVSINISFMVMGFSLFSSKPLKIMSKLVDQFISWILIINFSWFTFNTFSLLPRLDLVAIFLAITVFGCSFFIFNRYKMKLNINKAIPFLAVAFGASASISSLVSILFRLSLYIQISIFSGIFIIFLYFLVIEYRYFLWALIPIPLTLPILGFLVTIDVIRSIWFLAFLSFSTIYLILFQIIINLFKVKITDDSEEIKNSILKIYQDKKQLRLLNLTSLFLNSVFFSLLISILIPLLIDQILFSGITFVYQILDFLIIWPVFILFSLKYMENSEFDLKIKDPLLYFNRISLLIYLLIPLALAINILLFMLFIEVDFIISFFTFLLSISGVVFFEFYIIERKYFYFLFNSIREKFTFWSWTVFCNIFSFFFFIFYPKPFLLIVMISILNQLSLYFLSYLGIPKEKISSGRVILYYTLFISGSFYLGSLISDGLVSIFEELAGITYYTLLFQNSILIIFVLSIFLIKIDIKLKSLIELILFTAFQGLFAMNWIIIFSLFNSLNLFSIILITLIETCFLFKTVKYFNVLFFEVKKPKFLSRTFSSLIILLYFEVSVLIYGLMFEIVDVGFIESILVSQLSFFVLTLLDIYSIKKIQKGYAQLIHTISYLLISVSIFLILNSYVTQFNIILSLELLLLIFMQFYTNYSFFNSIKQLNPEKEESIIKGRSYIKHFLGIGFYTDLLFVLFQVLLLFNADLQLILLGLSVLTYILMIIDTYIMKFLGKSVSYLKLLSWLCIGIFTASYLIWYFNVLNLINFFTLNLLILIETCLTFQLVKYIKSIFFEDNHPNFVPRVFSFLIVLLYFEVSLLIYGLMFDFVGAGILESILVSQILFFTLTLLDIYSLKRIKKNFALLIHTLSFFVISLLIVFILNSFISQYPILLSLEALIFIIMQFYTTYSFFASLRHFKPEKLDRNKKLYSNFNHVLGTCLYIDLCLILVQALILVGTEPQLILLSLSLMIHVITIIDILLIKFLGKVANYFKVISWIFIMIFTTTYLIWLYVDFFIEFLLTSIPLIIFILILEMTYLFKLLDFWKYISLHKRKIRSSLLLISYFDFISWPIYFVRLDPILTLNLFTLSLIIMIFFSYIDKYFGVLKEKALKTVRITSFLTLGLLLSINVFILLSHTPNTTFSLNLSVSLLIFVVFLGIVVKPFKGHSLKAFAFWASIFSLLSVIISDLSQFWQILLVLVPLTLLIYPFVFLLEELRKVFNKFVDKLIMFLRKIELLIINAFKALFKFVKTHFKIIWFLFSASVAIFLGILLSELFLSLLLGVLHPTLLTIAIFAFLILVVPSSKTSDPDVLFKRRMLRLSYGWGSVIAFLFIYITPVWYIFTIFISIAVAGSIVLIFIGRKEEREKISVKWRFYTLLSLFIFLIIFGILFFIQLLTINI